MGRRVVIIEIRVCTSSIFFVKISKGFLLGLFFPIRVKSRIDLLLQIDERILHLLLCLLLLYHSFLVMMRYSRQQQVVDSILLAYSHALIVGTHIVSSFLKTVTKLNCEIWPHLFKNF